MFVSNMSNYNQIFKFDKEYKDILNHYMKNVCFKISSTWTMLYEYDFKK